MTKKHYELHLRGLSSADGEITSTDLIRLMKALGNVSKGALSLMTTGKGGGQGSRPRWLDEAAEFSLVGLGRGSTVLNLEAKRFRDTAKQALQPTMFQVSPLPSLDDTPLDVVSRAIREVQTEEPNGDYFDQHVLRSITGLLRSLRDENSTCEFLSTDGEGEGFELNEETRAKMKRHELSLPKPAAIILTGKLDEIAHSKHLFILIQENGSRISGSLIANSPRLEALRELWGERATVQGVLHFKADGTPRHIDAERIVAQAAGDIVLSQASLDLGASRTQEREAHRVPRTIARPMDLVGTWPGEEPIEDLMADLN